MKKYRVTVCREYWGYIDVKAKSEKEAIRKIEEFDYADDEEFVSTEIVKQAAFVAEEIKE